MTFDDEELRKKAAEDAIDKCAVEFGKAEAAAAKTG